MEHPLYTAFNHHIRQQFPFLWSRKNVGLLVAISGGVDSVVLAELLRPLEIPIAWAHCNFQLRGEQSDQDEAFVRRLADKRNQRLLVTSFDTIARSKEWKLSIEETARKLRYDWFASLLADPDLLFPGRRQDGKDGPSFYLITGHHANDHIETLLLNFLRGCGIAGLHGIPAKNGRILRPLLPFKREVIKAFALDQGITWVEDSTNSSMDYTRNYIRAWLPEAAEHFPQLEDRLLGNISRFSEAEKLYEQGLDKYKKQLVRSSGKEQLLSVRCLLKSGIARTLLWESLKDYGFSHGQIGEVEKLLHTQSGTYQDSAHYRIFRNRQHLVLSPLQTEASTHILIEQKGEINQKITFDGGVLSVSYPQNIVLDNDPEVAILDLKDVRFPLMLRKWKQGDYFYPLGMRKKKKVARFLVDLKCSLSQKQQTWVLTSGEKIIWILGMRIDDRFKVQQGTKKILKLKLDGAIV